MVAAASGDRPSLARATRLHLLLVAADHVRCGVDGEEAKRLLADAVDLVRRVGGHEREAAGGEPAALPLDPYLGRPGDHDDCLLGAVGVPRKAVSGLDLEQRAPRRRRAHAGAVPRARAPARRLVALEPGVRDVDVVEAEREHVVHRAVASMDRAYPAGPGG